MAMILDAFVGKFAEKLLDLIQEPVVRLLGVEEDLQQLRWRLENIKNVLVDAERKRYNDMAIDAWIRQLKDVMYDADDAIDLWRIKLLSDFAASSSSSPPSKKVRRFGFSSMFSSFSSLPLRNEISLSIKRINDRLDAIAKNKSEFNLQHIRSEIYISRVNSRQTSELVDTDVVGDDIENATKKLVERLVDRNQQQPCILLAISGMGGIGKTTLAQKIFNESRMQTKFSVKVWVCISQNFNEINLLKQIIRGTGEDTVVAADTKAELLCLLKKAVFGKEVFIVLDDVWQGQEDVWNELLRNPVKGGASICRILVTTRDENVARKMGTMHIHRVDQLSTAFGWKLLRKSVFVNGEEEDIEGGIEDIGIKIVEKCHGLPLAIKAISGVLMTKNPTKKEWKEVLTNNSWSMSELPEELRGALYLSYEDLPSHLKQCFLYLSLYPEDYIYFRPDLVRMWVAEGLVKTDGDWLLEDLAKGYYDELVRRNLLLLDPIYMESAGCRMHDLLRLLAKYLSEDESFYGNPQVLNASTSKSKLRRLLIVNTSDVVVLPQPTTSCQDSLRTLILLRCPPRRLENVEFLNFRFLRVLRLNGKGIQSLPNALHNMVHLRLLDLDGTNISMIPESIGCLTNLQILNLADCKLLHTLPRGITRLCNLRRLGVGGTPLSYLPKGIGELKQLNDLRGFVVGGETEKRDHGCNLEELGSLAQLRGLSIEKLERASTASFTFASNPHLKVLGMYCTPLDRNFFDHNVPYSEELERLFEQLSPPPCIEILRIGNYFGRRFPSWMMSSTSIHTLFSNLTTMNLQNCVLCPVLPPLGRLPQLKFLRILGASSVVTIGPEFLDVVNSNSREGSNIRKPTAFPKLEVLTIESMPKWEEWSFGKEIDEQAEEPLELIRLLPQLQSLELINCRELRGLPKGLSHSGVQCLIIRGAQKLTRADNLPHLTTRMKVMQCGSMERVSDLPALRELYIIDCPAMMGVGRLDSLQRLFLRDGSMECLPKWLPTLIQQRAAQTTMATSQNDDDDDDNFFFELVCNMDALKRCCEGCPDWPIVQKIPRVIAREFKGTARLSYTKQPFSYATNF